MLQIASQRIFISKTFWGGGGHAPGAPRKLVVFGYSGLLPQTLILDRTLRRAACAHLCGL